MDDGHGGATTGVLEKWILTKSNKESLVLRDNLDGIESVSSGYGHDCLGLICNIISPWAESVILFWVTFMLASLNQRNRLVVLNKTLHGTDELYNHNIGP